PQTREQLAGEAALSDYLEGETLFRAGDMDAETLYLLEGEIAGHYADGKVKNIVAGSLQGRYPIGDSTPRRFTALVASSFARGSRLDMRYTEQATARDQVARSENFRHFDPGRDGNRWGFRLLQSRAFHEMPTGSIERMFQRFEEVDAKSGEVIVREGDAADFFYVIKDGAASVSKHLDAAESESIVA